MKDTELAMTVEDICRKKEVKYHPYDNRTGENCPQYRVIKNVEILIVEGIHSFNEAIGEKIGLRIFIDSNEETLRQLRYNANIKKRGFQENEAGKRIDKEMEEYYQFVAPNKSQCDVILNIDERYNLS